MRRPILTYYHVRITVKDETHDETKLDLDGETLERNFLAPYRTGSPITVNGRAIPIDRVARIRVSSSNAPGPEIMAGVREERATSRIGTVGGPSIEWQAAARATDVTDQYITGPPGLAKERLPSPAKVTPRGADPDVRPESGDRRSVFLVAGRDNVAVSAVVTFVRSLGLRVVEWEHAVARTGVPNPYVGDVVVTGMSMADATLVLLTPDDMVQLRGDLVRDDDDQDERACLGQARPNVFYEAGIADALGRERTIIVEVGRVKSFSDVAGRHVLRLDGSSSRRNALAERLKIAGLDPDTSGADWLSAGDIAGAVEVIARLQDQHRSSFGHS
jgi:hypothetical protein